jgi:transcriptional regulator with XRE-family HTH domain
LLKTLSQADQMTAAARSNPGMDARHEPNIIAPRRAGAARVAAEAGARIKAARRAAGLTLEAVSELSGVSRAMLSKVERGEKSPTLGVLIAIARGLGTTTSALIGAVPSDESVAIIRVKDRVTFLDPETGFQRHLLSPAHADHRVEVVLHIIPPGAGSGELPVYAVATDKYLVVTSGCLTVYLGSTAYVLEEGDAMYFDLKTSYRFENESHVDCTYLMTSVRKA